MHQLLAMKNTYKGFVVALCATCLLMAGMPSAWAEEIFAEKSSGQGAQLKMEGVQGYVAGQTRAAFHSLMTESVSKYMSGAIVETARKRGMIDEAGRINLAQLFAQSPELKEAVRQKIKEKLKDWLPGAARDLVREHVFQNALGPAHAREVEDLLGYVSSNFETSFNAQADALIDGWYTGYVGDLKRRVMEGTFTGWLDVTNLRGSIRDVLSTDIVMNTTAQLLSMKLGESTVRGIQDNLEAALGGELAPEVVQYLEMGPEKFEEFEAYIREKIGGYLPSAQISRLRNMTLNRPLFRMPSGAYGAVLAAMAAKHYAAAFKGVYVDAYELKRGIEVTRVMVWQLKEKDYLNVKLMDLAALSSAFGSTLGMDAWSNFMNDSVLGQLDKLDELSKKLDELIMKPFDLVGEQIRNITDQITEQLTSLQNQLMAPVRGAMAEFDASLENLANGLGGLLPENFNGIPANWQDLKEQVGMEGVFGDWGDLTPRDLVEQMGMIDDFQFMGEQLEELNDRIADMGAVAASEVLETLHLLGPASVVLGVEEVPARDESDTNELDPVLLHNGEFVHRVTDVVIPGRGLDVRVTRIYRNRSSFLGPFGQNWTHAYAERLMPWNREGGAGWTYVRPDGMKFFFKELPDGSFESPQDVFLKLTRTKKGFELADPYGNVTTFYALGLLREKRDAFGNSVRCIYNDKGWLMAVVGPMGRPVMFRHNDEGLIIGMEDIAGRTWAYEYDDNKNLIAVRSPVTPDFPLGKRTEYRYSSGYEDEALNHNLIAIMDPKGSLSLRNKYGTEGIGYDRVIEQRYGEREQRMYVQYAEANMKGAHPVASRAYVTDRRRIMHVYEQDASGHLIGEWIVPEMYEPKLVGYWRYDADGRRTLSCRPSGRCVRYKYDDGDLLSRGDIIAVSEIPVGDAKQITTKIAYDKRFHKPVEVTDPLGNTNKYEYDEHGALARECNVDACSEFQYNSYGQIMEKTDPRGVVTEYAYHPERDPDGNGSFFKGTVKRDAITGGYLARVTVDARDHRGRKAYGDPVKSRTTFIYDDVGNVIREADPLGRVTRYSVNSLNQIVKEKLPDTSERRYAFDANENLVRVELIRGDERVLREFEYDALDNLTALIAYPDLKKKIVTRYERDPAGNLIRTILPEGNSIEIERDDWGRPACKIRGSQRACIHYNEDGAPVMMTRGKSAQAIGLDAFGQWQSIVNPRGTKTQVERDLLGRITSYSVIDSEGALMKRGTLAYDAASNQVKRSRSWWQNDPSDARDVVERLEYDALGSVVRTIDPRGSKTNYVYDGLGNLAKVEHPTGVATILDRDAAGRVTAKLEDDQRYGFEYDVAGNRVAVADPMGARTSYDYSVAGDLLSTTDANGNVTRYETDGLGRVMKVIAKQAKDASGVVTAYVWDGNNRLKELIDPRGDVTRYTYDALDRVLRIAYPDGSAIEQAYLDSGATSMTDRAGNSIDHRYDDGGLLASLEVRDLEGSLTVQQLFSYDGLGNLINAVDMNDLSDAYDDVVVRAEFDSLGNSIGEWIGDKHVVRKFDEGGNVVSMTYPSGKIARYEYDVGSRLILAKLDGRQVFAREYDGLYPARAIWGNGVNEKYIRDRLGRAVETRLMKSGDVQLDGFAYAYDPAGDLTKSARELTGGACSYSYDGMRRLIGSDCGGDQTGYKLDGSGSWVTTIANDRAVQWRSSKMNAYTTAAGSSGMVSFGYDANGNLTSDGEHLYGYDALGRLDEVRRAKDNALVSRYAYDALGRRVRKTVHGKAVDVAFNGWNEIGEYNDKQPVVEFVNGSSLDQRLALVENGELSFLHTDRLGSVVGITNGEGKLTDAYTYDPYGRRYLIEGTGSANTKNPFAYTGRILDETGLMQYRQRYYHPLMGRFTSMDPLGYKNTQYAQTTGSVALALSYHKGFGWASQATLPNRSSKSMTALPETYPFKRWMDTASAFAPGEPNLYLYAVANPLSYVDPMGLASLIFDRSDGVLTLYAGDGQRLDEYAAANNVGQNRRNVDPLRVGGKGPSPNGTFPISQTEFRTVEYGENFYNHWSLGDYRLGESEVTGDPYRRKGSWAGDEEIWDKEEYNVVYNGENYNLSQGNIRFRIGDPNAPAGSAANAMWRRGIFLHGGRHDNEKYGTLGCVRGKDSELDDLAYAFIVLHRRGDPVTEITLQD